MERARRKCNSRKWNGGKIKYITVIIEEIKLKGTGLYLNHD